MKILKEKHNSFPKYLHVRDKMIQNTAKAKVLQFNICIINLCLFYVSGF